MDIKINIDVAEDMAGLEVIQHMGMAAVMVVMEEVAAMVEEVAAMVEVVVVSDQELKTLGCNIG